MCYASRNARRKRILSLVTESQKVWIDAYKAGALGRRQTKIAANAAIIRDALADTGIVALVDEATGYQDVRPRYALQAVLDAFLRKSFAAWSKKIPDDFYKEIYRLRGWKWTGMSQNRFWIVGKYTKDLIYRRLAPGVQEELDRLNPKDASGRRKVKNHQWLTEDIGHPALSHHLHAIMGLMRASKNWDKFMALADVAFPHKNSTVQIESDSDRIINESDD